LPEHQHLIFPGPVHGKLVLLVVLTLRLLGTPQTILKIGPKQLARHGQSH